LLFRPVFFLAPLLPSMLVAGCDRKALPDEDTARLALEAPSPRTPAPPPAKSVRAIGQLGPGRGTLVVSPEPPANAKLTAGAPLSVEAHGEHFGFPAKLSTKLDPAKLPLRIPIDVADGAMGPVHVKLAYHWCGLAEGASCRPERVELLVDVDTSGDAPGGEAHVTYRPDS
jgi:hypothetical protein